MMYAAMHLLLGPRLPNFGLGISQALYPGFLWLPGQVLLFPATVILGQREIEKLAENPDAVTIGSLVSAKSSFLTTHDNYKT